MSSIILDIIRIWLCVSIRQKIHVIIRWMKLVNIKILVATHKQYWMP